MHKNLGPDHTELNSIFVRIYYLGCYKDMFCAKQPACHGRLFDCQFFHADAWVCISGSQDRNYDWLEYENGIELGHKGHCISEYTICILLYFEILSSLPRQLNKKLLFVF